VGGRANQFKRVREDKRLSRSPEKWRKGFPRSSRSRMIVRGEAPMIQIAVIQQAGEWRISRDGQVMGTGVTRSAAIELAQGLAFQAAEGGQQVELLVQGLSGELAQRYLGSD
jgi:hypothetical protein